VVARDELGRYELTPWGKRLATPVRELVRWAAPLMTEKQSGDSFRSRWLEIPLDLMFGGFDPNRPDLEVEVEVEVRAGGEEAVTAVSRRGEVHSHSGHQLARCRGVRPSGHDHRSLGRPSRQRRRC
jgi:hypothetical protein